jgi:hypothetical protein
LSEVQTLLLLSARWHHAEMRKCEVPGLTICAIGGSTPLSLSFPLSLFSLTRRPRCRQESEKTKKFCEEKKNFSLTFTFTLTRRVEHLLKPSFRPTFPIF